MRQMSQDAVPGTDLRGIVRLIGRQWLVLVIALTAAVAAVAGVAVMVPPT